jgi:hypothetical protein
VGSLFSFALVRSTNNFQELLLIGEQQTHSVLDQFGNFNHHEGTVFFIGPRWACLATPALPHFRYAGEGGVFY